jgi:peptidoglycan/xylan/chitin deacetylase (PgdA/CDA1 family)
VRLASPFLLSDACVVLAYHHAEADGLRAHLQYLRRRFDVIGLESLVSGKATGRRASRRPRIALTFDDGYRDAYTDALPVLQAEGLPATVFLVTEYIGTGRRFWWDQLDQGLAHARATSVHLAGRQYAIDSAAARRVLRERVSALVSGLSRADAERAVRQVLRQLQPVDTSNGAHRNALLDWNEVRQLQSAGISLGSHTGTHPILSRIHLAEAEHELRSSRQTLEQQLGVSIETLAYPHGQAVDMTPQVIEIARECGYSTAVTTIPGAVRAGTDRLMLPRITVDCSESPRLVGLKASGLWPVVTQLRVLMQTRS